MRSRDAEGAAPAVRSADGAARRRRARRAAARAHRRRRRARGRAGDEDAAGAARHRGAGRVRRATRAARHRRRGERRARPSSTISTPRTTSSCCPATHPLRARRDDRPARDRAPRPGRGRHDPHRDASPTRPVSAASCATRTAASRASSSTPTPTAEEREINEINTSIYCFRRNLLAPALRRLSPENAQGEYYLTDAIAVLRDAGPQRDRARGRRSRPRRSWSTTACSSPTPRPSCAAASTGVWMRDGRDDGRSRRAPTSTRRSSSSPTCACCRARSSRAARSIGAGSVVGPDCHLTDVVVGERAHVEHGGARVRDRRRLRGRPVRVSCGPAPAWPRA